MATLPSPTQVSGKHNAIYEAYYKQVDPKGQGTIEAMDAAKFLKKSGLSDVVLSRIWDLSDPKGRGCLDKAGFFVSLKLVALAQAGNDINMRNILLEPPNPPKVGELPKIMPQTIQSVPVANNDWTMKTMDKLKYEQLFESLQPVSGLIAGNKVKGVLMDSKLPLETLGKIWDLADQDKDGNLDKHEFIVAMHLVYQALDKRAVPATLPVELQKPKVDAAPAPINDGFGDAGFVANFPKDIAPPPVPPLPAVMTAPQPSRFPPAVPAMPLISTEPIVPITAAAPLMAPAPVTDWVVSPSERIRYEGLFRDSDRDKDGLVSGLEVKNVFLQSGVPQNCLAHIWALCDTNQSGKLTVEQFALAMWMVERKKNGIEPPDALTPNMIPPSLRGSAGADIVTAQPEPQPTYSNPELEMISKEIEELARERRVLETDIAQKEADIRIKSGEVRSLQSELDTLAATLKQLENQKGEAQKRLDDLKTQVNKIREQCQKQEATINEQEGDLNSKKSELQKLKDEETSLEKEYESNRKELDNLTKQLQDTNLQISQVRAMVTQLLETQRQMNDALLLCKAAIEANDAVLVSDYSLKIEPDFTEAKYTLEKQLEQSKPDPFHQTDDSFGATDSFSKTTNGFGSSDPFTNTNGARTATVFDDSFSNAPISGFDDAFGSSRFPASHTKDPFSANAADPFGDKKANAITPEPGKDDFGSDPFAILHAPTGAGHVLSPSSGQKSGPPPRPESPSPALPPKKAKQPPPRPAPPRPLQGPTRPAPPSSDGFGSSGGFADFADFDNKLPTISPPSNPLSTVPKIQHPITQTTSHTIAKDTRKQTSATTGAGLTDFSEDPFKDYRYEDPFSIKDPFADDEDGEESSEDVFSDSSTKGDNPIANNFNAFNDMVNNFELNSNRNQNNLPSPNIPAPQLPIDNNFAMFDSFDNDIDKTDKSADFFDAFNDNFKSVDQKNFKANHTAIFDAFGGDLKGEKNLTETTTTTTTKSSKIFDAFNDNFEDDDFFKPSAAERNDNAKKSNGNFAEFDRFEDIFAQSDQHLNNTKVSTVVKNDLKTKVTNDVGAKVSDKFAADYSKTDDFDDDLQAVLQRSLVDQ